MPEIPAGLVSFLFTDIQGSTRLWEEHAETMSEMLPRHDECLRSTIETAGGYVFKTVGDAVCAAFASPRAALQAALDCQLALKDDPLLNGSQGTPAVRVRMGLHSGEPVQRDNDYFGPSVNRVARVESAAHGGQILVSSAVHRLLASDLPTDVTLLDMGAHRLKDLSEPENLYQVVHPALSASFPPIRSLTECPNNLPLQLTAFVGREKELTALHQLVAGGARLVTILGPGGIGKTRIALQVAADRIERFPGGVWWVDLTSVSSPENVLPAIAALFDLREAAGASLTEQIVRHLRDVRALIVLDNCEQVTAAAPGIDALLRTCPNLVILATSRAALNLSSEHTFLVSEFSVTEAIELFTLRARQLRPEFTLNDKNQAVIERICTRLECIPLAVELAAAQMRLLSAVQIEKQLTQRFRLLVSPYRDVSQRQRTLRGAVDWSYELLPPEHRTLFAELSVFLGGFLLEDAEAICSGKDIYFGLAGLCDQSLLRSEETETGQRFRMLETLREYGAEKLRETGQAEAITERWAYYFSGLAQSRFGDNRDGDIDEGREALLHSQANLRAALEWLLAHAKHGEAALMSIALTDFWEQSGAFREGRDFLERSLAHNHPPELEARILITLGWLEFHIANYAEAEAHLQSSLELCEARGDLKQEAMASNSLALAVQAQGRFGEARDLFARSLKSAQLLGDAQLQAARLSNLGMLATSEGHIEEARNFLQKALSIYERREDAHRMAVCLCNLSDVALSGEQWEEARTLALRSEAAFRLTGDQMGLLFALTNLAQAASRCHSISEVQRCLQTSLPLVRATDLGHLLPTLLLAHADVLSTNMDRTQACFALAAAERAQQILETQELSTQNAMYNSVVTMLQQHDEQALQIAREDVTGLSIEEIIAAVQKQLL